MIYILKIKNALYNKTSYTDKRANTQMTASMPKCRQTEGVSNRHKATVPNDAGPTAVARHKRVAVKSNTRRMAQAPAAASITSNATTQGARSNVQTSATAVVGAELAEGATRRDALHCQPQPTAHQYENSPTQ